MKSIVDKWYGQPGWLLLLAPFSLVFSILASIRRWAFRNGLLKSYRVNATVVVVGNITVGGSGKTPLVIALVKHLTAQGIAVGVISRGYGGSHQQGFLEVMTDTDPLVAGDEPCLIKRRTNVPFFIARSRVEAAQALEQRYPEIQVIIADDGLQHYRLQRDIEIAVVDGRRLFGNGWRLPVGPLRESAARLDTVDYTICNGGLSIELAEASAMTLKPSPLVAVGRVQVEQRESVAAAAGIGNPQRFFDTLTSIGLDVVETHEVDDHQPISTLWLEQMRQRNLDIVITEKDAVKIRNIDAERVWYLPVDAQLSPRFLTQFSQQVKEKIGQSEQ